MCSLSLVDTLFTPFYVPSLKGSLTWGFGPALEIPIRIQVQFILAISILKGEWINPTMAKADKT